VIREREKVSGKRAVIIGLSANAMGSDLNLAQNAGMDAYLTKPFHRGELYEAIANYDMLARQSLAVTPEPMTAISQKLTLFSRRAATAAQEAAAAAQEAPEMTFDIDTNFVYVYVDSPGAKEMLEVFGCEFRVGMSVFDLTVHRPSTRDQNIEIWKRTLLGETLTLYQKYAVPDKEPRLYEVKFSPRRDGTGKTIGARCLSRRIAKEQHALFEKQAMLCQ
jgi:CheY-like chemotaxis protein